MRARAGPAPLSMVAAVVVVGLVTVSWAGAGASPAVRPPALRAVVLADIGFGYSVTSQGPLDASQFPTGSPSAAAAAGALSTLGSSINSYERSWQDANGVNRVQDLVVRFPTDARASAFLGAARRALAKAEIVSSGPLPSIPGAQRTTYFASTEDAGVGQTVTLRVGILAAVLSYFSGASGNPAPITRASATRVASAQYAAMVAAEGTGAEVAPAPRHGVSAADVALAVLAVAVLGAAVTTPLLLRRRHEAADERSEAREGQADLRARGSFALRTAASSPRGNERSSS
jgi:hypothetical protein